MNRQILLGNVKTSIGLGISLGIITSVAMLLVTQSVLMPYYYNTGPEDTSTDPTNVVLSPQDWDFTNTSKIIDDLIEDKREEAMIGYAFANGYFEKTDEEIQIKTEAFYGDRSLIYAAPIFDQYPRVVNVGNETDFDISMKIFPSYPSGISIEPSSFRSVVLGFADAIASSDEVRNLNETELQDYKQSFYQVNSSIMIFNHIYYDGSVLQVEIINSEVILIQFVEVSHFVFYENGLDYQEVSTEYYLFDLSTFDSTSYIDSVITMVDQVEG